MKSHEILTRLDEIISLLKTERNKSVKSYRKQEDNSFWTAGESLDITCPKHKPALVSQDAPGAYYCKLCGANIKKV